MEERERERENSKNIANYIIIFKLKLEKLSDRLLAIAMYFNLIQRHVRLAKG